MNPRQSLSVVALVLAVLTLVVSGYPLLMIAVVLLAIANLL